MVGELGQAGEVALVAAKAERQCMQMGRGAYELAGETAGETAGGVEVGKCVARTWPQRWRCRYGTRSAWLQGQDERAEEKGLTLPVDWPPSAADAQMPSHRPETDSRSWQGRYRTCVPLQGSK